MPFIKNTILNDSRRLIIEGGEKIHQGLINLLQADIYNENEADTSDYSQLYNSTINTLKNNPYIALSLPTDCTTKQIRMKYLHLAKLCHPDKLTNSNELFYIIKDAYELLSDSMKRRIYDLSSNQQSSSSLHTSYSFTSPRENTLKNQQKLSKEDINSASHPNLYTHSNTTPPQTTSKHYYNNQKNNHEQRQEHNSTNTPHSPFYSSSSPPTTTSSTMNDNTNEYINLHHSHNKKKSTTLPRSLSHPYHNKNKTKPIKLNKLKSKKAFKSMESLYGSIHSQPDQLSRNMNKEINTSYNEITTLIVPTNFHHVKITSNSIQLMWDNQIHLYPHINIVYELNWREVDIESSSPKEWKKGSKYINGTICIKRNLSPSTFYQFRIRSKYKNIFSSYSDIITIETKADTAFLGNKINDHNNNNNQHQIKQQQHKQQKQQEYNNNIVNSNDIEIPNDNHFDIMNFRRGENEYGIETSIERNFNSYKCVEKLDEKGCISRSSYCLFCTVLAWIVFYFLLQGMIECHKDQTDASGQPVEDNCEVDQWVITLLTVILFFISFSLIISFIVFLIVILKQCFNMFEPSNNSRRVSNF